MKNSAVTVVMAHAAWADGSSFSKVIMALAKRGIRSVAAPLPLTTFEDDVAALNRMVARVGGPVVLVGHAYSGAVIGAAQAGQIKGLVYINGLVPDEGETVVDVFGRGEPHPKAPKLAPDANGLFWLSSEAFLEAFAQKATKEEQVVLEAVQRPISPACITVKMTKPLWKSVPSHYLISENDVMILEKNQVFMAERIGAKITWSKADHVPMITDVESVAKVIAGAADQAQLS